MNGIWGISGYPVLRHTCTHRTPLRCHIGVQKVRLQEWRLEGEPDFRVTAEGRDIWTGHRKLGKVALKRQTWEGQSRERNRQELKQRGRK